MKYIKLSILLLFVILFVSCSDENPVTPGGSAVSTGNILDSVIVNNLITKIEAGDYGEIHSLLIYKDETLVVEKYFRGYNREQLHICYSVTKSFASALIGIAIDREFISGTNANLLNCFSEYNNIQNPGVLKNSITLHHVLSMSSGFEWDEWTLSYSDPDNDIRRMMSSSDWIKFVLDLPVIHKPGTYFTYNSGCSTLLGGIILKATGDNARTFGFNNLLNKLEIESYNWEQGPNNITNTFGGLSLKPIDLLKFGRLYLHKGNWNGVQVISENWVNNSTAAKIDINASYEYAYQWWRYKDASSTGQALHVNDVFYADGWGGQFIWVVPHLKMVAVSTGGNFESGNEPLYFFRDYILPAAYNAD
jgi:CubicO group peptidase (beta-lactamase class C family)